MSAPMENNVTIQNISDLKGKGLISTKDLKVGDVIFEEAPLVSAQYLWNETYKYQACEFCMRSMETAEEMVRRLAGNTEIVLPWQQCCEVKAEEFVICPRCQILYCCSSCRDKAWQSYHKVLCLGSSKADPDHPINRLQECWRNSHYPPETSSIMLVAKMIAMLKQSEDKAHLMSIFSQFVKATRNDEDRIVHKLLGKQFQDNLELLRSLTEEALGQDECPQWFTPEGFRSVFALIGRNGQGIGSSSVGVWAKNCEHLTLSANEEEELETVIDQVYEDMDRVSGPFLNCEGTGLYLLQSACNHSCIANAEITFPHSDHTMALQAITDIQEGQEIHICYLDECDRERSRHSRQKSLRENYLFTCECPKCQSQADDPDITSEEDMDSDNEEDNNDDDDNDMN